ncbi:hypothetical protein O7627_32880 [Solwaraspora sp. WMMD1047]|uniref:hypothetical protein n=1 Tax=Solwaraspora sp. WMMD1047 TaxID=3016102 RepID=UPI002417D9C6|nr:hypothetical protein [Solwaraspora sp. WMMD1047]MDG4834064.1 hypothetical protein [Solwaraspora sp. WMMD1047]
MLTETVPESEAAFMASADYDSYSQARAHFRELLDAARRGHVASVRRDTDRLAVVDARRLQRLLATSAPFRAQVVAEAGGWSVLLPGLPLAADGNSLDEAVDDMVNALREYAEDWHDRLSEAPNHAANWALVQLIGLSTDEQLRDWLVGAETGVTAA